MIIDDDFSFSLSFDLSYRWVAGGATSVENIRICKIFF